MSRRVLLMLAAAAAAGLLAGWTARGFVAVDACLDAGGQWIDRGGYCYGARRGG